MKNRYSLALIVLLIGCQAPDEVGSGTDKDSPPCKGVYSVRDAQGDLKKFNSYEVNGKCLTDNVALTVWETSTERRRKQGAPCTPQSQFPSRSLVSSGNYYSYRDGKVYLDLDSTSGEFRRLILGEDKQGQPVYSRLQGCFFQRTGTGVDAGFGSQLLLDTSIPNTASTDTFNPMEIFRIGEAPGVLQLTRFDQSEDWDYRMCPYLSTPWGYCDALRDGNIMYWPVLTPVQQSALLSEALLIRKEFNYAVISRPQFESVWLNPGTGQVESDLVNLKFEVVGNADVPWYIDAAWREYVRGARPIMPDVASNKMPPVCYPTRQRVTLSDGSFSYIQGEACYVEGQYVFTGP